MQFIDLKAQYKILKNDIDQGIANVLEHGQYIMGPEVTALETKLADFANVEHCVTCSSGTDALVMALLAYDIGDGDVVITTPFTFIATAEAIKLVGATPLFVDVDERSFNICPVSLRQTLNSLSKQEATIHEKLCSDVTKVKAIIAVDLFGLAADYDEINSVADDFGLLVVEDAAQGFGGSYKGRKSGGLAHIGCTSFFPAKPLGCYGDGGAIFTNDSEISAKLKSIRVHGQGSDKYQNVRIGLTGRLDSIQAAVLLPKLGVFECEIGARQAVANSYISKLEKIDDLILPVVTPEYVSAWAQFTIRVSGGKALRDELVKYLSDNNIPSAIYYPIPLHQQAVFAELNYKSEDFPISSLMSQQVFSLPMHPYLAEEDISKICEKLERFFDER